MLLQCIPVTLVSDAYSIRRSLDELRSAACAGLSNARNGEVAAVSQDGDDPSSINSIVYRPLSM